jgi:hypothetical protein
MLTDRMIPRLAWTTVHAALSAISGMHLSVALDCSPAGATVVAGAGWFCVAWLFSPTEGLIPRRLRLRSGSVDSRLPSLEPFANSENP